MSPLASGGRLQNSFPPWLSSAPVNVKFGPRPALTPLPLPPYLQVDEDNSGEIEFPEFLKVGGPGGGGRGRGRGFAGGGNPILTLAARGTATARRAQLGPSHAPKLLPIGSSGRMPLMALPANSAPPLPPLEARWGE